LNMSTTTNPNKVYTQMGLVGFHIRNNTKSIN
jgi:hypothetical protein